nr:TIGR00153 family protein [Desulfobacterales bacterium]
MRIPIISLFITSPFDGLQEHAKKINECSKKFRNAFECYFNLKCEIFENLRGDVARLESEADAIKRRIRGHIPKGTLMPVDKFQFFMYLREQDQVFDVMEDVLDWLSYRPVEEFPEELCDEILKLVDSVIEPIERLSVMVSDARRYFRTFSEKGRRIVKEHIKKLRQYEHEADILEAALKKEIFARENDPTTIFYLMRLVELIGNIADHAENAGDMMRAMIAR